MKIGEEEVEDVHKFAYLGAVVSDTGGTTQNIKSRLNKARMTYGRLRKTKVKLFKALVRSVLLYGSEAWKITRSEERTLQMHSSTSA